jgi:23S rRNA (guanine745-N1)-methyltransferase
MNKTLFLACPVCGLSLAQGEKNIGCTNGHSFDLSAKGYVNLLLSRDKHSHDPGDNKEMVASRRRFLEKGFYLPLVRGLAKTVSDIAQAMSQSGNPYAILDAGCGEGYYTGHISQVLSEAGLSFELSGMDISKEAVRAAVSRYKGIFFAVASLFKLPVMTGSLDLLINCFAPASDGEFSRVLKKNGRLICIIPGKDHLYGLKRILYGTPTLNDEKPPELPSFALEDTIRIKDTIAIEDSTTLQDLLSMTPYFWRTPQEGIEKLRSVQALTCDIEFLILIYRTR